MFKSSYKIATIWGIPIRIHISLVVLFVLLIHRFQFLDGLIIAVALLVSIVIHELAHSVIAMRKGCRVRQITLMFLGGAAQMERIPTKPLDEFLMALAGPAVSLVLGTAFIFGGRSLANIGTPQPVASAIYVAGLINIGLAIFNLIPAFPMDGGRIFRALLTPKLGRLKATMVASRLGKIMAVLLGLLGLWTKNLILVAIGFFVYIAAGNEYRIVRMQETAGAGGFAFRTPFFVDMEDVDNRNDRVIIGPAPYEKGASESRADVHRDDDSNDSSPLFRF